MKTTVSGRFDPIKLCIFSPYIENYAFKLSCFAVKSPNMTSHATGSGGYKTVKDLLGSTRPASITAQGIATETCAIHQEGC